ncbi:hypothetical protein [Aureimonas sp. N4]|uniref:hypothetical protein n=1 Tax=Aureimonas sp. N4 TaxID=1638165 RepID=UPI000AD71745|nr:hypothetical protein [Aureimonas sp. N4]
MSVWEGIDSFEAEARMRALTRRLVELEDAIGESQRLMAAMTGSFSARLAYTSLDSMRTALLAERIELVSHRRGEVVNVALSGDAFDDHTADIGSLGFFLIRLQKLYTSIAQALTVGPKLRGPIHRELSAITNMRMASVYPSSFGVELVISQKFDIFGESTASSSLNTLFNLLNSTTREAEVTRLSAELGPRSINHLRHVLDDLGKVNSGATLSWKDVSGTEYRWNAPVATVNSMRASLSRFRTVFLGEQQAIGVLVGANLLRDRFELQVDDGTVIEGKVARSAKIALRELFGRRCRALLDITRVYDTATKEDRSYATLTELTGEQNEIAHRG